MAADKVIVTSPCNSFRFTKRCSSYEDAFYNTLSHFVSFFSLVLVLRYCHSPYCLFSSFSQLFFILEFFMEWGGLFNIAALFCKTVRYSWVIYYTRRLEKRWAHYRILFAFKIWRYGVFFSIGKKNVFI